MMCSIMKISQKTLLLSALLFLISATPQAMTVAVEVNFRLATSSLDDAAGLNNANLLFRADFAEATTFQNYVGFAVADTISHSFTISGASEPSSNGTFSVPSGVSLFSTESSTSLFASNGDPLSLGETGTSIHFSPTQVGALIGDTLTLAYLQSVFGEIDGLWHNNGATYDLTTLSTNVLEVSGEALGTNLFAFSETASVIEPVTVTPAAVPVPAAVWLFGSALFGLIGFKRKKTT